MRRLPAILSALLFAASHPAIAQTAPSPTQTLRIALAEDTDMLDPTLARTFVGRIVFAGLCDKLFDIDTKLNIVPQLATSYEWPDSKTLLLHLRPGVLFQDGTKVDAEAVKYTLDRDLTMQASARRGEISSIDHVEIVDPLTVRVVLKSPSSPLLAQFTDRAGMILSPTAAKAEGANFALHPVCAGPFSFAERVPQDRIVLDRFPQYWNASAIHFARVIYQPIVNSSVRLTNLQAGASDMAERIQPSDTAAIRNDPKLKLSLSDNLGFEQLTFNVAHGPRAQTKIGQDARVRQAFELSLDREAINQVVYGGLFTPTAQAISKSSPFYSGAIAVPPRDVAKAKALLAAAGVKTPLTVELMLSNSPDIQQMGEVIQSMAAEAGFDVKLRVLEFGSSLNAEDAGDFEIYLDGWSGRPDPDGNLWNFLHTGAPLNDAGYSDADVDGWLQQARETADIPTRKALYEKIGLQTQTDLPVTYLYEPKNIVGMTAKLSGFEAVPDGLIRLQGLEMKP
jgi:peptide/nickel transport system substrate-binding protein